MKIPGILILSLPFTLNLALAAKPAEVFEVNALYGRGTDEFDGYDWKGASVAGGFRRGDHLFQLEIAGLQGESARYASVAINPWHSSQSVIETGSYRLESLPLWVNYR